MKVVDLSQRLAQHMPVYPGTEPPLIDVACTVAEHGFTEKKITLYSHTGTHIDAPAHILEGGPTLDQLPIGHFYGRAACLDLRLVGSRVIDVDDLGQYRLMVKDCDFLLLNTGWSRYWGEATYFDDYPILSVQAAEWLVQFDLKGLGVDTISLDEISTTTYTVHKLIFGRGMISIENLTNLDALPQSGFYLSVFPLKIEAADGSPVRAVAIVP